jgi:multidrug efflux pump subunit AcrA (membrane-fusion protein)
VRQKNVDVGQFVTIGSPVGVIYAIDYAEIRLPLPDSDLAFLDLPLVYRGQRASQKGPRVTLRADFAGQVHEWEGRIVRTEGEIDAESRMVHAVAQVTNPYGRGKDPGRPPLAAGLFVEAEIEGHHAKGIVALPRAALRENSRVLVVDSEDRLRFRTVDLLRVTREEVFVRAGLAAEERVCLSPLEAVTDGMKVRTDSGDARAAEGGQS